MKKKLLLTTMALVIATSMMTACGQKELNTDNNSKNITTQTTNNTIQTKPDAETNTKETTEKDTEISSDTITSSGKWIDFDNRQFTVNGHTYTLGKSTLQDMIDDGCPFDEESIANVNNNLNKNTKSQGFKIVLDKYWTAQVYVGNYTDENATIKDCPITEVYLPNHPDETQNIISFAFPLTMTEDELKTNAGEPSDYKNYPDEKYSSSIYEYNKDSEKYYQDSGYKFEFGNGQLKYVTIDYLP